MNTEYIPEDIIPSDEHIDIWPLTLDLNIENNSRYRDCLSEEENARADRLKIPEKQNQFVIVRACLRRILANILNTNTDHINIEYSEHGKPCIEQQYQGENICFNLSHSGSQAIIALTLGQEIGVDIEKMESGKDYKALSRRFFSGQERQQISSTDESQTENLFYACWARKEAFVKAIGDGFRYGLDNFDVSLEQDVDLTQIDTHESLENNPAWFNININCQPGYAAALTVSDPGVTLRYRDRIPENIIGEIE